MTNVSLTKHKGKQLGHARSKRPSLFESREGLTKFLPQVLKSCSPGNPLDDNHDSDSYNDGNDSLIDNDKVFTVNLTVILIII